MKHNLQLFSFCSLARAVRLQTWYHESERKKINKSLVKMSRYLDRSMMMMQLVACNHLLPHTERGGVCGGSVGTSGVGSDAVERTSHRLVYI